MFGLICGEMTLIASTRTDGLATVLTGASYPSARVEDNASGVSRVRSCQFACWDADSHSAEQLALAQIKYVIVRLLQNFDGIKSVEDNVTMSKQVDLSTKPILNSRVRLHRAKVRERT